MNTEDVLRVKFWGVRGSHPSPGASTVIFGGNTPCVEVQAAGHTLILDAGTGIIALGRELMRRSARDQKPVTATLLFSHLHHDHTQGLPFFLPAYAFQTRLYIFGPHPLDGELEQVLSQNMIPPVFPLTMHDMGASKMIRSLSEEQVIVQDGEGGAPVVTTGEANPVQDDSKRVLVRAMRSYAHPGGTLIYRIEWRGLSLVYATDTEGYASTDRRLATFACGADLLIHDAQYTEEQYLGLSPGGRATQGWGHSTVQMACEVARCAEVERLVLFHYDPGYSDQTLERIEAEAQTIFPGAVAAREGMEIILSAGGAAGRGSQSIAMPLAQAAAPRSAI
jgi:phosphoribosyl 1,2-cyclic phosphodiesterase